MDNANPLVSGPNSDAASTVTITFVQPDGSNVEVAALEGDSVMRAAIDHDVDGIVGECGGDLSCATCHVFVDPAWFGRLPPASDEELDLLEATSEEPTAHSRLCCQIRCTPNLNGLVVQVSQNQR